MTADSTWALQAAIYTALRADAAIKSLLGDPARVYDHVPDGSAFPYVTIGETRARPWDTGTTEGMEATVVVHSFSRYRGLKEAKDIMAAVTDALDDRALSVTGHTLIDLRFESSETALEGDGLTRHGRQTFRAVTQSI